MERYDYEEAVKSDIEDYIKEHYDTEELKEKLQDKNDFYQELYDDMFVSDSVTGNASGSYYCNAWKAEEALCHNLDLLGEAGAEFGDESITNVLKQGPEVCDVAIRCYLLGQLLGEVIDHIEEEIENYGDV